MRQRHFRPAPATADLGQVRFGIVEFSGVDWCPCRRLEIAGGVGQPPWLLYRVLILIFIDFFMILSICFNSLGREYRQDVREMFINLIFIAIEVFSDFHYTASSRASLTYDFSVFWFVSCLIEFVNTLRNVYR